MEQPVKKIKTNLEAPTEIRFPKLGAPILVYSATFQAETFWPGKLGHELGIHPQSWPNIKMLWIDGRGLQLEWPDGTLYTVPAANVKGFVHL